MRLGVPDLLRAVNPFTECGNSMLARRLYYSVKPYVPWRLRMLARQYVAFYKRRRFSTTWPVSHAAARPPAGWSGWPDKKQFAFVITHDVEDAEGLHKCRQLAAVEKACGFRSSFNFIPEGPYRVSAALRAELAAGGFEIGIHDLKHDGKLFRSREEFTRSAKRINGYARAWGATGYRSGFMLRQLDWLHDLNIAYDASTFDTDPFEPQPDGAGTIFPFWIPSPQADASSHPFELDPTARSRGGYVELPYTLPQDSTLFLVLRERDPEIWLKKLDWVAAQGGMALVNVHPDYVRFEGEESSASTFPVSHYIRLLEHVRTRHASTVWHATPKQVAAHVLTMNQRPEMRRPLRVCMVTHSHYAADNRVIRYAEALAARGDHVDVIGLRLTPAAPVHEDLNGVHVHRLHDRFSKAQHRPLDFLLPILRFGWKSAWWIARTHRREPFDVFHIHNIPDFLVFAALYPRLKGAKVILDIHDLVPEFYGAKFGADDHGLRTRVLRAMERISARGADHVIIANHLWFEKYQSRTHSSGKCSVFINNVDETIFSPRPRVRRDDRTIIMFPGGLQWHQGLDIAIRAMPAILAAIPQAELHLHGDGNEKPSLQLLVRSLGLDEKVRFFAPVPARKIAEKMAEADLGIVPKRAESFGNEAYSTKIMEFMSLGVPLVISNTKIDRYYFNDEVVRFFQSGDEADLAAQVIDVLTNQAARQKMIAAASAYAAANCWGNRFKDEYLALVDSLVGREVKQPAGPTLDDDSVQEPVAATV